MTQSISADELKLQISQHLSTEARHWLADLLHDQLGGRITNSSVQAEIVLRAWEPKPEMAHAEMLELKKRLDEASAFLVALVRTVTPPSDTA